MRLPEHVANPTLAALIQGGGFPSLERFAQTVNIRGWHMQGVKLSYDHISVKRWLTGSCCQNPEAVAAVLGEAWGIPIPVRVIWPFGVLEAYTLWLVLIDSNGLEILVLRSE